MFLFGWTENPSSAVAATHQSKTSHQNLAANPVLARPKQQQAKALVTITQKLQVEWTVKGSTFYKYGGSVINESKDTVASLTIVIHRLYGPIYGLSPIHPNGNFYSFPAGIKSLAPGEKIDFVYIHHSDAAMIYIQKYALTWPKNFQICSPVGGVLQNEPSFYRKLSQVGSLGFYFAGLFWAAVQRPAEWNLIYIVMPQIIQHVLDTLLFVRLVEINSQLKASSSPDGDN